MVSAKWLLLSACCMVGCVPAAPSAGGTLVELQARSAFDLGCPHAQLQLYNFDDRTKGVAGCGRRLTYVRSCQVIDGTNQCAWVLDTPSFAQQQWPRAPKNTSPVVAPAGTVPNDPWSQRTPLSSAPKPASRPGGDLPCADRNCARLDGTAKPATPQAAPLIPAPPVSTTTVDRGF